MKYKVIGDSCCDYAVEAAKKIPIERVALTLQIDNEAILDTQELDTMELLEKIKGSKKAPSTACPSIDQFLDAFKGECEDIYVVTLSAQLSGTFNSACQAAKIYNEENEKKNIHVFNSLSAAAGEIAVCLKIIELAEKGLPFEEVVSQVESFIANITSLFVLEDLSVFAKNGRLNHIQALATDKLKIKLVMGGTSEGVICKCATAFSIRQALTKMVNIIAEKAKVTDASIRTLVVTHCNCLDRAEFVVNKVKELCRFKDILICRASGVSTVYANNGGVIVGF